jgi:hypothetical protein
MTDDAKKVVKLEVVEVGEGFRFEADEILSGAMGQEFACLAIIGELSDGKIWVSGTANAGETLILLERAKRFIVFEEDV